MKKIYINLLFICFSIVNINAQVVQVTDINPGISDSSPQNFAIIGDDLLFNAFNPSVGIELYRYNKTDNTTVLVQDITPGGSYSSSDIDSSVEYNGDLYFSINSQLYKYETSTKTVSLIPNIYIGDELIVYNNKIYMKGWENSTIDHELYSYDSVTDTVALVSNIYSYNGGSSIPYGFIVFNDKLYFSAETPVIGRELYEFNSVTGVTRIVENINSTNQNNGNGTPRDFTIYNNELYFGAFEPSVGYELFKYDPIADDVVLAADIFPGTDQSGLKDIFLHNNKLYYQARSSTSTGVELHSFDASTGLDTLVKDIIIVNQQNSSPTEFFTFNDRLFFYASSATTGGLRALFAYNDLTDELTEIAPSGFNSLYVDDIIEFDSKLYIGGRTENSAVGQELYVYDDVSVTLVEDIYPGYTRSEPKHFTVYKNELYFSAQNTTSGYELFKYNPETLGVDSFSSNIGVKYYKNALHIEDDTNSVNTIIYNMLGQFIMRSKANTISTETLKPGVYLAIVTKGNRRQTLKFAK